jgi:hypothetical protein
MGEPFPGYLKPAAAPGRSHQSSLAPVRSRHRNPSRRRFRFPPPAPPRRQGAHPRTRKEVRNPLTSCVVVFVHRSNRGTSPEFEARAAASTRRSAASSPRPLSSIASPLRVLRVDATRILICGRKPKIRVSPASPPPVAAAGQRTPLPRRLRAFRAVGSRSDASDRISPSLKPASHRNL